MHKIQDPATPYKAKHSAEKKYTFSFKFNRKILSAVADFIPLQQVCLKRNKVEKSKWLNGYPG